MVTVQRARLSKSWSWILNSFETRRCQTRHQTRQTRHHLKPEDAKLCLICSPGCCMNCILLREKIFCLSRKRTAEVSRKTGRSVLFSLGIEGLAAIRQPSCILKVTESCKKRKNAPKEKVFNFSASQSLSAFKMAPQCWFICCIVSLSQHVRWSRDV